MKTKYLKLFLVTLASILGVQSSLIAPTFAEDVCSSSAPNEVKEAAGCSGNKDALPTIITNILYVVIGVSGLIAVAYIIIGGVNYMTSAGDPGKTKKAKDTILYAIIGLVVCALAFGITQFAIDTINNSTNSNSSTNPANGGSNNNNNNSRNNY